MSSVFLSLLLTSQDTIPPCQLSLWEETGIPGENPRLSEVPNLVPRPGDEVEKGADLLFSHEDWVRVALRKSSLRLEPAAIEVKGKCANHF
jgi:hypothetical protein